MVDEENGLTDVCRTETSEFVTQFAKDSHTFSGDDSLFYFETDFLPVKGNTDYLKLMKTLVILESQRMKVFKDISELQELKLQAIEDPYTVKEKIFNGDMPCLSRCIIEKVPDIDFSKYPSLNCSNKSKQSLGRKKASGKPHTSAKEDEESPTNQSEVKVRGRVYTHKKPQSFNQLWTVEEQLRLEQLLSEIPPQPVEYRRWEKIAEALGSRTAQQVCSRVQKYFKKLEKAGINSQSYKRVTYRKRAHYVHKQHKHFLYRPSTFFPGSSMNQLEGTDSEDSSSDSVSPDLAHWEEIHRKIQEDRENELKVEHIGFKCKKCRKEPIMGIRWECKSCQNVSFCSDCMSNMCNMNPPPHPITHHFKSVDLFNNLSYRTDAFSCDNYLDPNAHLES